MNIIPKSCISWCWPTVQNSDRRTINGEQSSVDRFDDEDGSSCFDCFPEDHKIKDMQDEYVKGLLSDQDSDDSNYPTSIENATTKVISTEIPKAPYYYDPTF